MTKKAGYLWLKEQYEIDTLDYWVTSYVLDKGAQKTEEKEGYTKEYYRSNLWPGESWHNHLEFALKREGLHLELLRKLLPMLDIYEVTMYVKSSPTGKYCRMIWYFYEVFTGNKLSIKDITTGNYIPLADPDLYVTSSADKISRQRINFNLLGSIHFSPVVRLSSVLRAKNEELKKQCDQTVANFPEGLYSRAVNYLYIKESKSSYAIESEAASSSKTRSFMSLLESVRSEDFLKKENLLGLQNSIVEKRFSNDDYRSSIGEQVYVGQSVTPNYEKIHYVAPKPEDVDELMGDFLATSKLMLFDASLDDLTIAAVISYVFNFIHPFSDGNGRIHRFLMHYVLANRGFGPEGGILPISAVILNRMQDYDTSLESFSKRLIKKIDYELDERLRMTVQTDTKDYYRYIDCTQIVEIFYQFAEETICTELPAEIGFLRNHDQARAEMKKIVDLPERHAELFITLCQQNGGLLSKGKRTHPDFEVLTDEEVTALENVIAKHFPGILRS